MFVVYLCAGASLKFTVLNPKGRVWLMVAGGGASVIYAGKGIRLQVSNFFVEQSIVVPWCPLRGSLPRKPSKPLKGLLDGCVSSSKHHLSV